MEMHINICIAYASFSFILFFIGQEKLQKKQFLSQPQKRKIWHKNNNRTSLIDLHFFVSMCVCVCGSKKSYFSFIIVIIVVQLKHFD